jgi:XTP/dITP diphosphohydrolase
MKFYFVTGNKHKYKEVKDLMDKNKIEIELIDLDKPEDKIDDIRQIAENAAKKLADSLNKPVMVDDTGVFFSAYNNFPGPYAKYVFKAIGYDGFFKLLEGEDASAYFMTVAAFCMPKGKPISFEGRCEGRIISEVRCKDKDVQPYERIFMPEGHDKVWGEIPDVKADMSHRVLAFQQLADYLKRNIIRS